jgi:hypothetical protein
MRQTPLLRWIDAAEARLICTLAQENPARAIVAPAPRSAQPFNALLSLRKQLCLGRTTGQDAGRGDRAV